MVASLRLMWTLVVVAGVCLRSTHTFNWGSTVCNIADADRQWLEKLCGESLKVVNSSVAALQEQLDRVMSFVDLIKSYEDTWLATSTGANSLVRVLSKEMEPEDAPVMLGQNASLKDETTKVEGEEKESETGEVKEQEKGGAKENQDKEKDGEDGGVKEKEKEEVKKEQDDDKEPSIRHYGRKIHDKGPNKGECVAQVTNNHATIGMFYIMSYNHGHCANRHPITVPIRYCLGYCESRSFIEREDGSWSQANHCRTCKPLNVETVRIPLSCDDGFTFEKAFNNVVDCKCRRCESLNN